MKALKQIMKLQIKMFCPSPNDPKNYSAKLWLQRAIVKNIFYKFVLFYFPYYLGILFYHGSEEEYSHQSLRIKFWLSFQQVRFYHPCGFIWYQILLICIKKHKLVENNFCKLLLILYELFEMRIFGFPSLIS